VIAANYGISDRTVERYFKAFKSGVSVLDSIPDSRSKSYPVKFPIVEKQLVEWVTKQREGGQVVTGPILSAMAKKFALAVSKDETRDKSERLIYAVAKFSHCWVDAFKDRNKISSYRVCGESA
jgi:hypothetical protein